MRRCDSLAPHLHSECLDARMCTKTFKQIDMHGVARLPCDPRTQQRWINQKAASIPCAIITHTHSGGVCTAARAPHSRDHRNAAMEAALLGGREGVWQPCSPSCSGRNGSAAPLPCHHSRRRQWFGASQPSALRFLPRCPRAPVTYVCHLQFHATGRLSKRPCTEQPVRCAFAGDQRCVWPLRAQKRGSSQRITSTGARPSSHAAHRTLPK